MNTQEEEISYEFNADELGDVLIEWEIDEYPEHERSRRWYIITGVIGAGLIIYSLATANFLFAVIVLMFAVITLLSHFVKPERIPVVITTTGVVVGDMYYDYMSIRDFSIVYEPPEVKNLYLDFYAFSHPMITVPLEDVDPNIVRDQLLVFCQENLNRNEEHLTDVVRRLYKL